MTTSVAVSGLGSGIASQIDTTSLIQKLVAIQQLPLNTLQTQEKAVKSQISALGSISSALTSLSSAAQALVTSGVLGITAAYPTDADFTATPGDGAAAGSYDVQVNTLATSAKWHSAGFASTDTLQAGTFTVSAEGKSYSVTVAAGAKLSDLVAGLKDQGAPVTANVLNDGTYNYLSLTATQSGFDPNAAGGAASALSISFQASDTSSGVDPTSTTATKPAVSTAAVNATFSVDGLDFTRRTNTITDVVPDTTLTLQEAHKTPSTLTLSNDPTSTQKNLQSFVNAYNAVINLLQAQLNVTADTDRSSTLAGDSNIRSLQQSLQSLVSTPVAGLGSVRSLADLGVEMNDDNSLSVDAGTLQDALARDPADVNAIFSDATGGIAKLTSKLVDSFTLPITGILSQDQSNLQQRVSDMDDQASALQDRITAYQTQLQNQFAAMQSAVTGYVNIGNYLTAVANANKSS